MTLADVINQSNMITILRVKSVDEAKKMIVYEKVEDIRGKFPTAQGRHVITGQLRKGDKTVCGWSAASAFSSPRIGRCNACSTPT